MSIRLALTRPQSTFPRQAAPPLMNAWEAHGTLTSWHERRRPDA
jgi:hypothetical protein